MCTAFHSKSAQFDAFKTCQMLYKWKIHNSCRTHKTEPLAVTLYKMRTLIHSVSIGSVSLNYQLRIQISTVMLLPHLALESPRKLPPTS